MNVNIRKIRAWRYAVVISIVLLTAFMCCFALLAKADYGYAFTDTNLSDALKIDELLLDQYDTSDADGKVFNGKRFESFVRALRNSSESKTDVSALSAKNADTLRNNNGGKDIVVEIDGLLWTVTDLRKADNGHMIATLWLASSTDRSQYNTWAANTPTAKYPSNMYSTSLIRAQALNSGGCGYVATNGATTLTTVPQSDSHKYAKFTMDNVNTDASDASRNLSLTKFIIRPRGVAYQSSESMREFSTGWNTQPNDAWGSPNKPSYSTNMNYSAKSNYNDWADDYLWLPSLPETGYTGFAGYWGLSTAQRSHGTTAFLRSGAYDLAQKIIYITTTGGYSTADTNLESSVRPAFHFDLTAVSEATDAIAVPEVATADASKEYNGDTQTVTLNKFDRNDVNVTITGKNPAGKDIAGSEIAFDAATGEVSVKQAGTYTAVFELINPASDVWNDAEGGTGSRTLTFTITPKQLTLELSNTVNSGAWQWTVGGKYTATLTASGIADGDTVKLTASYASQDTGASSKSIAAQQAGDRTVATIDLSEIAVGEYRLTAALDKVADDNDNINYSITTGLNNVGLPKLFTVQSKKVDTSKITWQYSALGPSGNPIPGGANLDITEGKSIVYALFGTLESNGEVTNKLEVKRSSLPKDSDGNLLVEIDNLTSSFNGATYTEGYCNQSASKVNHYTTKVLLKVLSDDYLFENNKKQIELSINWEITKADFDLSGVKWKYKYATSTGNVSGVYDPKTTQLQYNDGKIIRVEIDSTTLPLGLSAPGGIFDYQNASGIEVKKYVAMVAGNTLEYDDQCFNQPEDITLNWEIFGKGIVVKWKPVPSGTYILKELNCDPKYTSGEDRIVHYKYYAPDGSLLGIDEEGRKALADKVAADNIGPENPQTFKIVAYLDGKNSGNYRLLTDPAETTVSIGNDPYTAVQAQLSDKAEYDGQAHYTKDDVKFGGASIGVNDFTLTYYLGTDINDMSNNTKLDSAPVNAGKYVIVIEMNDESYLLEKSVFAVAIEAKKVALPTINAATYNGSEYDIMTLLSGFDEEIMSIDGDLAATNAGEYRIVIALKSGNYAWETDGEAIDSEQTITWAIEHVKIQEYWSSASGTPNFVIPSKYAEYVQATYEYVDLDGNPVAESDLVLGQQYKLVAKLTGPGASNFMIVGVDGNVLTDPTKSVSAPFTYGYDPSDPNNPNNPNNSGNGGMSEADNEWYKKMMKLHLIVDGAMAVLVLGIIILVAAILKKVARKNKVKAKGDNVSKPNPRSRDNDND